MKKLLLLITGLLLLFSVEGQILRHSNHTAPAEPVETPDFYDEYDAVYAAFATKPHDTIADLQEALVYSLDTAGYWDRIDVLYIFAAQNYTDALINWKNPGTHNATLISLDAGDFTQWQGYDGDGTGYISTNWNPTSNGVNYTLNDASVGFYKRDTGTEGVVNFLFGDYQTGEVRAGFGTGPTNIQWTIHTYDPSTKSVTAANGFFMITRTASNATAAYQNGSSVGSDSYASNFLPTNSLQILKCYSNDWISSLFQISVFLTMDGTDATDNEAIYDIIQEYMTAIGSEV